MEENARKSPCFGCEKQSYKCHGSCEEYLQYSEQIRKEKEAFRKHRDAQFTNSSNRHRKDKKWSKED